MKLPHYAEFPVKFPRTLPLAILSASFCVQTNSAKGSDFPTTTLVTGICLFIWTVVPAATEPNVDLEISENRKMHIFRKYLLAFMDNYGGMKVWATECVHSKVATYAHWRRPHLTATYHRAESPFLWASTSKCSHGLTIPSALPESGR